jgi:hypothetical protein
MTTSTEEQWSRTKDNRPHGSPARVPGDLTRALCAIYLRSRPEWSRERLIRRLKDRLTAEGVLFHERSLRRQLSGAVDSVPPELENTLKRVLFEDTPINTDDKLQARIVELGLVVARRDAPYVPAERAVMLTRLWLFLNPGTSKRALAKKLCTDLAAHGVGIGLDALQSELAGRGQLVRREVLDQLLAYLETKGIHSEAEAETRLAEWDGDLSAFEAGRGLVDGKRFRALSKLWQVRHREASSRRLAALLRERLVARGVNVGLDHLQRLVSGKARRVRVEVVQVMESMVREVMSEAEMEAALSSAVSPKKTADLAWVAAQPIAELAREWLHEHPGQTMRQLALRVAQTAKRMGYSTSHNTIQPILGGWKQRTRGYIYRAVLMQFDGRRGVEIPAEHVLGNTGAELSADVMETYEEGTAPAAQFPNEVEVASDTSAWLAAAVPPPSRREPRPAAAPAPKKERGPTLEAFVRDARKSLQTARSPHLVKLLAMRAARQFDVEVSEVIAMLSADAKRSGRPARGDASNWSDEETAVADDGLLPDDAVGVDVAPASFRLSSGLPTE